MTNDQFDDDIRADLEELRDRKAYLYDENRAEAVEKRHAKGGRTARENITDLCDPGSFKEIGSLVVAAQRGRRSMEDLIKHTPADGLVMGLGTVNAEYFGAERASCILLSYDYTVLAGTQGAFNHKKTDRMMALAKEAQKPIIFFVEGGGGRPGDVDLLPISVGGLDISTWAAFCRLSGKMPRIAIASGYCFAGNAAIAGCADVIIGTESLSLGMGGPAMIEGGGLGKYHPKEVGPAKMHYKAGSIDLLVKDEAEAVAAAQQYVSYFQGRLEDWECADQKLLRNLVPENRKFGYNVMKVIDCLCDTGSVLELRGGFARNLITALVRIEGRPMGLIANSTRHLGGAIDSDASDKAARFMQLCDAFNLPILSLCDAPGFMVGPDCERTAMVRHASRLFMVGANLSVPIITVVLRKAYGLGAMAMAGSSLHESFLTVAWPTGEFGAMGLEGAVKLGYRKELEAKTDPQERQALYDYLVQQSYQHGKALNAASFLELDEVIDPMETRAWIGTALNSVSRNTNAIPKQRYIDSW